MVGLRAQQWMTDDWQSTEWLWKAVLMFVLYILMSVLCWTQWTDHIAIIYSRLPREHIEQLIVIFVRSTLLKNKDWQTVRVFIFITQKCDTKTIYQTLHKQIRTCKNLTVEGRSFWDQGTYCYTNIAASKKKQKNKLKLSDQLMGDENGHKMWGVSPPSAKKKTSLEENIFKSTFVFVFGAQQVVLSHKYQLPKYAIKKKKSRSMRYCLRNQRKCKVIYQSYREWVKPWIHPFFWIYTKG